MNEYSLSLIVLAFVLGVSIGSFVNVLVFRLRSGAHLSGRSKCLSCAKPLRARMLVPLFSFLWQRARCAYCGVRLSWQYPIVEALMGFLVVVVLVTHHFDPLNTSVLQGTLALIDTLIWATLLAITVYDLKHKIIPDSFSFVFAMLALLGLILKWKYGLLPDYYLPIFDGVPKWIDLAAGPLLAVPFALLWLLSRGRAMGLGDAKLAWGIGWFLGFSHGLTSIIFAFWSAFFPSLLLLLLPTKKFTMKSEIPFAPFLILGTFIVYAFGVDMLTWAF